MHHYKIATFIEFPDLETWCDNNPNIITKILNYFECYCKHVAKNIGLCINLADVVVDYLPESHVASLCCYFAQAINRKKIEFIPNVKGLVAVLHKHIYYNTDVLELFLLLQESTADWHYIKYFNPDSDKDDKLWCRWLRQMDYVFRFIIWLY